MSRFTANGNRWRELAAWLVIVGIVALVAYQNAGSTSTGANESRIHDIQFTLQAKLAVALKSFQSRFGTAPPANWNQNADRLILEMESNSQTPEDALRTAVIAGELQGKDQALRKLNALSQAEVSPGIRFDIDTLYRIYNDDGRAVDPLAQEQLIKRHDYFAQVALAYGVDSNAEPRKSITRDGLRMAVFSTLIILTLLVLLLLSVGLCTTALVFLRKGKLQRAYVADPSENTVFLESFALYLALFVGLGLLYRQFGLVGLRWQWLASLILPVALLWTVRRGKSIREQLRAFGWHRGRGWSREIAAGVLGYIGGLSFVAIGFFATFVLIKLTGVTPSHPITQLFKGSSWWQILQLYGVACIFAPVMEETMFRGALFHDLRRRWGWFITAPVVAFIFAVLHPQGWVAVPVIGSLAVVMAALREWRGSIIAPIVAHACNNFIAITLAVLLLR